MDNVVEFYPYEVYEFTWGSAIKRKPGAVAVCNWKGGIVCQIQSLQ